MQKKIAFDIDGVLTENKYLPKEEQTEENYLALKPNDIVINIVKDLLDKGFDIYIISSRDLKNNWKIFGQWCVNNKLPWLFSKSYICFNVKPKDKPYLAQILGCAILVDDTIEPIAECDGTIVQGVLLCIPGRYSTERYRDFWSQHLDQKLAYVQSLEKFIKNYFTQGGISF